MSESQQVSAVLVHGGFVDGAGWRGVYRQLRQRGYQVSPSNQETM